MAAVRYDAATLIEFLQDLLVRGGFSSDEASAIARSLTLSERLGYASHGLAQVGRYIAELSAGNIVSSATPKTLQETANSIVVDAQLGAGPVVMPIVLRNLYAKLATQASVTAAVRNCGHVGRLSEWVEQAAEAGYAALLFVNDNGLNQIVAPPGGRFGVTSTNPIAFGVPLADGQIFSVDMSTAAIALGKVERAKRAGVAVPPDCIQDASGAPTRDPVAFFATPAGAILPMGGAQGYKGFALSIFVDLLVAGLSGGQAPPAAAGTRGENCAVLTIWNPQFFSGLDHMQAQAAKYIGLVKACPPVDATKPVRLPGERTNVARQGGGQEVELSQESIDDLALLATQFGVATTIFKR
jgi:LDH2 family malate/lactate/ureidoglycolate dehydrogenase